MVILIYGQGNIRNMMKDSIRTLGFGCFSLVRCDLRYRFYEEHKVVHPNRNEQDEGNPMSNDSVTLVVH